MNLFEISQILKCAPLNPTAVTGIGIDSRLIKPGNLFIAICGERFNGHDFVAEAVANGAAAIVCNKITPHLSVPQLLVPDTTQALADIASAHRQTLSCKVIALTGSNGKTTVKEMIASILPQPSYATPGNLNNHIGVPLSVLQLNSQHRYAVFELGANHLGEIAHTVAIVQPQVTLINNIAGAHIGEFGSMDSVARAKGEIYQGLLPGGAAIVNDDDTYAHHWDTSLADKKVLRFSRIHLADISAHDVHLNSSGCGQFVLVTPQATVQIELKVPGMHNVSNALAAAACVHALGIALEDIAFGLCHFTGVAGRMTFRHGKNNATVIDDTYNANLRSTLAALDVLAKRNCRRIFVFGDMGELGSWSDQHHEEVGVAAREHGIELLMTFGKHSELSARAYGDNARHYCHQEELIADLLEQLDENTTVLIKGSRSSQMEKIVDKLLFCEKN